MLSIYEKSIIFISFYALLCNFIDDKKTKKIVFISATTVHLIVISGLRSIQVGSDTLIYKEVFNSLSGVPFLDLFDVYPKFENGYQLVSYLFSNVFNSFNFYMFIVSTFVYMVLGLIIYKYSTNPLFSYVLYVILGMFDFNLSGLRQSIAMSIVLFSIIFLIDQKVIKFTSTIILAAFFHKTAIIFLIIYPLVHYPIRKVYRKCYPIIFFVLLLFGYKITVFFTTIFQEGYIEYINHLNISKRLIIYLGLFILSLFLKHGRFEIKRPDLFDTLFIINSVTVIFELFGSYSYLFTRLNMFNSQFIILLFPLLFERIIKIFFSQFTSKEEFIEIAFKILFILLVLLYYNNYLTTNPHNVLPYLFFWQ